MNLAVGDITYATFNIPLLVISHINGHPEGVAGRVLCIFRNGALAWVGEVASVFTLVAIATERYYAVIYPLGNKGKLTIRKLKVTFTGSTEIADPNPIFSNYRTFFKSPTNFQSFKTFEKSSRNSQTIFELRTLTLAVFLLETLKSSSVKTGRTKVDDLI